MYKTVSLIVFGILILAGGIYFSFEKTHPFGSQPGVKNITIQKKWEMPHDLEEISGIDWMGNSKVACIQDEEGIIYIYNLNTSSVEKKVQFTKKGDFEGVSLVGNDAYVLRSDGVLFKISDFQNSSGDYEKYETHLDSKFNFEGICYDKPNNRLLLAMKGKDGDKFKPVFAFDLATQKVEKTPVFKIQFDDPIFKVLDHKANSNIIRPSEIAINPVTKDIYILEGHNPKLLIFSPSGKAKKMYVMKEDQFAQAEGLTFDANGNVYISNESNGAPANILKVSL